MPTEDKPKPVGDDAWWNDITMWKVTYESAGGASGDGGEQVDYFLASNSRISPTGAGIAECLDSHRMTLTNIESIDFVWTDHPDHPLDRTPPEDPAHKKLYDLTQDTRGAGARLEVREQVHCPSSVIPGIAPLPQGLMLGGSVRPPFPLAATESHARTQSFMYKNFYAEKNQYENT